MLQSKVFANSSTTLPQPVREALAVKAGDTVRFFISKKGVQIVKAQSVTETTDVLARSGQS
jgi:bifunctional DNA-binding transcriptional regulator/antitoxin component of YhaV-PrlF toxin-antitoxin module